MKVYRGHPEAREGEVFLGATGEGHFSDWLWTTKRAGKGYDCHGRPFIPVFVQENEVRKRGFEVESVDWADWKGR